MDRDHELWQTLRYAGKAQDKTTVDTLMLKYRPIAPKPTTATQQIIGDSTSTTRRKKRKYVRVSNKNNKATCRSKNSSRSNSTTDLMNGKEDIVTLQLMPEISNTLSSESSDHHHNLIKDETFKTDTWHNFNGDDDLVLPAPVETYVTVESVTSGSVSHATWYFTDKEIVDALDKDTCPGFISDSSNHIVMVNDSYRRIVTGDGGDFDGEVIVKLVVDKTATFYDYRIFTCKTRLEYTWRETKYVKTVPCEVWKMEFGGFAWRLDTSAALTLWL